MKRFFMSLIGVVSMTAMLAGCFGADVKVNPSIKGSLPLEVSDTKPAFLFPVNLSHCGTSGDPLAMGISVTAGIAAKFGKKVISGQQLFDLVGNLSFELAETIDSQARAGEWKMVGSAETIATALSNLMNKILEGLAGLGLVEKGFQFKYIIALHSHGDKMAGVGGVSAIKIQSWGGIYDIDTKEILTYINKENVVADDPAGAAVLAQLPNVYNGIIENLINGK